MKLQPVPQIYLVSAAEMVTKRNELFGRCTIPEPDDPVMHANGLCLTTWVPGVRKVCVQSDKTGALSLQPDEAAQPLVMTIQKTSNLSVKGLLILAGLAGPTTSSVIAHEMMHAWLFLNGFAGSKKLTPQVEEGLCQLMSHLWLTEMPFPVCN